MNEQTDKVIYLAKKFYALPAAISEGREKKKSVS